MTEPVQTEPQDTEAPVAASPAVARVAPYLPVGTQFAHASLPVATSPVGKVRSTGVAILLSVLTLGIYSVVWSCKVHAEMKKHRGEGLGGGLALVLSIVAGIVMPYLTSSEVGALYAGRGQARPVSGRTGLWVVPGILLVVGPLVWFVRTNGALNAYWRSLGAR